MIPVAKIKQPPKYEKKVRQPGTQWMKANPDAKRPHPYWNAILGDLEKGFKSLCGYAAMLDPTGGTVDHYLSYKSRPDLAYEWTNYRFASQVLNASKKNADAEVLDPHEVGAGWFEIILPSLQMRVTNAIPDAHRRKAEYTLRHLKLDHGERLIRWRRQWYKMYQEKKISLDGLRDVAPLIADAVERQGTVSNQAITKQTKK